MVYRSPARTRRDILLRFRPRRAAFALCVLGLLLVAGGLDPATERVTMRCAREAAHTGDPLVTSSPRCDLVETTLYGATTKPLSLDRLTHARVVALDSTNRSRYAVAGVRADGVTENLTDYYADAAGAQRTAQALSDFLADPQAPPFASSMAGATAIGWGLVVVGALWVIVGAWTAARRADVVLAADRRTLRTRIANWPLRVEERSVPLVGGERIVVHESDRSRWLALERDGGERVLLVKAGASAAEDARALDEALKCESSG